MHCFLCSHEFQLNVQPEWIYELDSSHSGKFSRHLLLRIPGVALVNNWAVGHLVGQILAEPEVSPDWSAIIQLQLGLHQHDLVLQGTFANMCT